MNCFDLTFITKINETTKLNVNFKSEIMYSQFDLFQEGKIARSENLDQSDEDWEGVVATSDTSEKSKTKSHGGLKSMSHVAKSAAQKFSPKTVRKKNKASVAVMKVYPSELVRK